MAGEAGLRRVVGAGAMGSLPQAASPRAHEAVELRARNSVPAGADRGDLVGIMTAEIIPFCRDVSRAQTRAPVFIPVIAWWPFYLWPTLVWVRV